MSPQQLAEMETRWEAVAKGTGRLTFEQAAADMRACLAEVRAMQALREQIAALEAHARKRNQDMQAFAAEVMQLANRKYADYRTEGA